MARPMMRPWMSYVPSYVDTVCRLLAILPMWYLHV